MAPLLCMLLLLQSPSGEGMAVPAHATTTVRATRAESAPAIDGRDDDAVWAATPLIDQFSEARPTEGAAPKVATTARVAYDDHSLYIFVRAFDPHPDSIVAHLARRDEDTPSDHITVLLDPYHDRRTGYEFLVNPAGVKADYAIYNDGNEDIAWDGVWDVATRVDSLGWTAEYRIPLSQLHYSAHGDGTFGLLIWRQVQRYTEVV
ncbi:MAG: carbohydrate binding family 9 domain-containing protein, partial [Gemmatimonadota bacterium]